MKLNPREYAQKAGVQVTLLFAVNLIIALLLFAKFGFYWESNDDYIISSIASGVYGQGSAHVVYSTFVLGLILRGLYTVLPGLNWFWALQFAAILASYTAIGWVLMQRLGKRWGMAFYLPFLLVSCQVFYSYWNFTRTAAIAAAAGALCMLQGLKNSQSRVPIMTGGVLFFYGFCLRFESWLMVFAMVLAWLAGEAIMLFAAHRTAPCPADWLKDHRRELAAVGVLVAAILAAAALDKVAYAQEPWKSYRAYNNSRQKIYDYSFPDYNANKDFFDSVNISKEDYDLYTRWHHCDNEKLTLSVMQQLVEMRDRNRLSPWLVVNAAQRFVENPMFLLGLVLTLMGILYTKKTHWASLIFLYGAAGVLLSYLMYISRFPDRVVSSMGVCFAMFAAACFEKEQVPEESAARQNGPRGMQIGAVTLCILLLFKGTYLFDPNTWRTPRLSAEERRARVQKQLAQFDPDKLYLTDNSADSHFWFTYPIWQAAPKGMEKNLYGRGGWTVQLPVVEANLARFGVENPMGDVARVDDLLLMSNSIDSIEQNAAYVRRNYTPDATWSVYDVIDKKAVASFMRPMQPGPVCEAVPRLLESTQQEGYRTVQLALDGVTYDADTVYCLVLQEKDGEQVTLRTKAQPTETGVSLWVGIPYSEWAEDAPLTGYVAARAENTTETLWQTETVTLAL